MRRQLSIGPHHPPPGQAEIGSEDVSDRPRRARIACPPRDFAIADDLAASQVADDLPNALRKGRLIRGWLRRGSRRSSPER